MRMAMILLSLFVAAYSHFLLSLGEVGPGSNSNTSSPFYAVQIDVTSSKIALPDFTLS